MNQDMNRSANEVESRLRRSPFLALRDVGCSAHGATLILHGHLPTYYLKQIAQEAATSLEGVGPVVNQIRITPPGPRPPSGRGKSVQTSRPLAGAPRSQGLEVTRDVG